MSNQQEPRIDFETAKLAKQAGFDWWTSKVFFENGETEDFQNSNLVNDNFEYASPTHAHIMKWLRDVHDMIIVIVPEYNLYADIPRAIECAVYPPGEDTDYIKCCVEDTWEEAEAVGIKAALEYVIETTKTKQ